MTTTPAHLYRCESCGFYRPTNQGACSLCEPPAPRMASTPAGTAYLLPGFDPPGHDKGAGVVQPAMF